MAFMSFGLTYLSRFYRGGSPGWKRELKRKAFHQLTLSYLGVYFLLGHPAAAWAVGAFTCLVVVVEVLRLRTAVGRAFFFKWFGGILRPKEAERFSGTVFASLGILTVFSLFGGRPAIVIASMLALAWGDAVSPLVGMRFGWKPFTVMGTQRSVDGTLAGFATALAIALFCGFSLPVAAGAAAAFSLVDTFPVKPDDNLWIPIVYGASLFLLGRF